MSALSRLKLLLVVVVASSFGIAQEQPYTKIREHGPATLFITYKCAPAERVALRQYMTGTGLSQLESWKKKNLLSGYRVLFNRYLDADTWDMATFLVFSDFAAVDRWKKVEASEPGGLNSTGLRMITSATTYPLDLFRHGVAPNPAKRSDAIYLVIPYDYDSTDLYTTYADGYVVPQLKGWVEEGALGEYGLYINRLSTGRAWSSVLLLQYRNADGFDARDRVVAKVRARLAQQDAEWKKWSENKQKIRTEKQVVIADELSLP